MNRILQVSIHAPAWGATRRRLLPRRRPARFNSRSRVGSDDAYHAPTQEAKTMETAHQQTRLALAMKFFKENWQSVVLFLLFLKAFGLEDLLKDLFTLTR